MSLLNSDQTCRWHSFATTRELEHAAVQAILHAAKLSINQRAAFHLVLAGGTSPHRIYESLRTAEADWPAWHVYFGDERCLPVEHAERNSRMAASAWLDHVAIPSGQIHPIPAESGAETAAHRYAQVVEGVELFDLVLLGLGEDGHTASLFPNREWDAAQGAIAVHDAPKPPPDRVSLTAHRLSAARQVMFLVTGDAKRQAVRDWRDGANIPAASIAPASGADVYIEASLL